MVICLYFYFLMFSISLLFLFFSIIFSFLFSLFFFLLQVWLKQKGYFVLTSADVKTIISAYSISFICVLLFLELRFLLLEVSIEVSILIIMFELPCFLLLLFSFLFNLGCLDYSSSMSSQSSIRFHHTSLTHYLIMWFGRWIYSFLDDFTRS